MSNTDKTEQKSETFTSEVVDRLIEEQAWPELFRGLYSRPQPSHSQVRIAKLQEDEAQAEREAADQEAAERDQDASDEDHADDESSEDDDAAGKKTKETK